MIQVILIDDNGFYVKPVLVKTEDITDKHVNIIPSIGAVKLKWDGNKWIEGATPQEILEWEEANKPQPPTPNKTEILEQEVSRLEIEMLKMKKGMI